MSDARGVEAREVRVDLLETEQPGSALPQLDWKGDPIEVNEHGLPIIWTYTPPVPRQRPAGMQCIRKNSFKIFLGITFGGTALILAIAFLAQGDCGKTCASVLGVKVTLQWKNLLKYLSIPLVSILFTWWHVWLGIKMCFYPVNFVGCCPPVCGWQGIVPRRAKVMASRSCDLMIGRLLKIEEIIDRIEPVSFFRELTPVLVATTAAVVDKLADARCPGVWSQLPESVKAEIKQKILEQAPMMFEPVIKDVKLNINSIVDVKAMAIQILIDNKPLLVEMFQKIGAREFVFIQHFSAVLGFFCGVLQMFLWIAINSGGSEDLCKKPEHKHDFHCWAGFVVLPVSGLIIGYLTNYLGINLIFRPIWPHPFCGGYMNLQGVFLKRQTEVSYEMTKMICAHLVTARKMLEYVMKQEDILHVVLEIFKKHVETSITQSTRAVAPVVNAVAGRSAMTDLKDEVVSHIITEMPKHSEKIETYMDGRFDLVNTMSYRLSHLPPSDFEGMLHPVFQEDEWMVLLLGGVLGVTVGTLQAFALGS